VEKERERMRMMKDESLEGYAYAAGEALLPLSDVHRVLYVRDSVVPFLKGLPGNRVLISLFVGMHVGQIVESPIYLVQQPSLITYAESAGLAMSVLPLEGGAMIDVFRAQIVPVVQSLGGSVELSFFVGSHIGAALKSRLLREQSRADREVMVS